MILIKNARVFSPKALGKKDVLIAFDKILEVADCIEPWRGDLTVIDAAGKMLVPGFIEWFRSFDHDNHGWSTVGLAIHSNFVHDEELMRPVKLWYERLHARIAALPEDVRTPALVAIMAIEGFFYSHKFEVDLVSPKLKIQAWHFILENLVHNHAAAQTKH